MRVKARIIQFLQKQSFQPNFYGIFTNPFFLIRWKLFQKIHQLSHNINGRLIDFGCGRKPYENLFQVGEYIGVDIEVSGHSSSVPSKVDVYYDGKVLPFENSTFDSMICFEVLEHVFNPDEIILELNRVLKKEGKLLMSVPFCWNEHEVPFDYARYSSFGIRHLLEKNGFEVLELYKTGNFILVLFQLLILRFFEGFKSLGIFGYLLTLFFSIPLTVLGIMLAGFFHGDKTLYFNSVILAKKR